MTISFTRRLAFLSLCLLLVATRVEAHGVHSANHDFAGGLSHPLSGLDHCVAAIAVGLWAVQMGKRATSMLPASFLGAMVIGAVLGLFHHRVPFMDGAILTSVLVLGLFIAGAIELPAWASVGMICSFAIFHGYAHGIESHGSGSTAAFLTGLLVSTFFLHLCGVLFGTLAKHIERLPFIRFAGVAVLASGIYIWLAS